MKTKAYTNLVEIERIVEAANSYLKRGCRLPNRIILELGKLGDLGRDIEAYVKASNDEQIIKEVCKIPRQILFQIVRVENITQEERLSVAQCNKSLYKVANTAPYQEEQTPPVIENKKHQALPKELDNEDGKRLLGIAVEAGYLNNDYSRNEEKLNIAQTALLAEIISEKLKLKYKWVPFQSLWNLKGLAQTRGNSKDKVGTVRGGEEIEKLYK